MSKNSIHPSLKDKVVLITGGGSGIGAAHVQAFCEQGARVAFLDINTKASKALVAEISRTDAPTPIFIEVDLTDTKALLQAIDDAKQALGPIQVLVNNAAHDLRHELSEITEEFFDDRIAVNLKHLVFATQAVAPDMKKMGSGVIINTGSISWHAGFSDMPLYTTVKAGIEGLTRALAGSLGPDRIRVNCIIPGWVMTERQLTHWIDDDAKQLIAQNQCLPDSVMPEDIARMATWLASDDSRMCTNQTFVVDGRWI